MPMVAVLQMDAGEPDPLDRLVRAVGEAAEGGASLLVAPELATSGYGAGDALAAMAETADGDGLARLARRVEETGVALVAGFPERRSGGIVNAAAVLRPSERPVVYGKAQLYGDYERAHFSAVPVETTLVRVGRLTVGVLVCFDVEFPEHVRRLAAAGADLVAVPTALPDQPGSDFIAEKLVPVRAFENQVFVAYADWAGRDARFGYAGRSCLIAPDGTELIRAPRRGGFLAVADVEPADYAESRRINPYLAELRRS